MRNKLISDEFGKLEERLEHLETLAALNDQAVVAGDGNYNTVYSEVLREIREEFSDLQEMVFERVLSSKSIEAKEFLNKIVRNLIEESSDLGLDIAVSMHGQGRVPMHLIELALSSILACVKLSVESFRKQSGVDRIMRNLFPTCSFQMEIVAGTTEIHFCILHDGDGFSGEAISSLSDTVRSIRENVARSGGWFSFCSLERYGGRVEFKIPVARTRYPGYILRAGSFEAVVPSSCVAESLQEINMESLSSDGKKHYYGERAVVCFMNSETGIETLDPKGLSRLEGSKAVLLGAADFQFLVVCDDFQPVTRVRTVDDADLLEPGSWFRRFGVFQEGTSSRLLPVIDGATLVNFHKIYGGAA